MSIVLCIVAGAMKREPPLDGVLYHWDEAVAYATMLSLVSVFRHPVPV
jgi:hypothetical protein